MLVLSRKKSEVICIGDDIEISISEIRRYVVRIGITAPKHIKVLRKELIGRERKEKKDDLGPEQAGAN